MNNNRDWLICRGCPLVNGNIDDRVCKCGGYPVEEWIANHLAMDGGAMLLKEKSVTDISDGLQAEYQWKNK